MNKVELQEALRGKPEWAKFAHQLEQAMAEYSLDGVTVCLREMNPHELTDDDEGTLLSFDHENQRFEFGIGPGERFPAAWKVADRIDYFLNPSDSGGDG